MDYIRKTSNTFYKKYMNISFVNNNNIHDLINILEIFLLSPEATCSSLTESMKKRIQQDFKQQKWEGLLAYENQKPVGMIVFFESYSTTLANPCFFLHDFFVLPKYQSKGIGTALFKECVRISKERGYTRIEWNVHNNNYSAIHFYEQQGAKKTHELLYHYEV